MKRKVNTRNSTINERGREKWKSEKEVSREIKDKERRSKIHVFRISEGYHRNSGEKPLFVEIMAKNFPGLMKDTNI